MKTIVVLATLVAALLWPACFAQAADISLPSFIPSEVKIAYCHPPKGAAFAGGLVQWDVFQKSPWKYIKPAVVFRDSDAPSWISAIPGAGVTLVDLQKRISVGGIAPLSRELGYWAWYLSVSLIGETTPVVKTLHRGLTYKGYSLSDVPTQEIFFTGTTLGWTGRGITLTHGFEF